MFVKYRGSNGSSFVVLKGDWECRESWRVENLLFLSTLYQFFSFPSLYQCQDRKKVEIPMSFRLNSMFFIPKKRSLSKKSLNKNKKKTYHHFLTWHCYRWKMTNIMRKVQSTWTERMIFVSLLNLLYFAIRFWVVHTSNCTLKRVKMKMKEPLK